MIRFYLQALRMSSSECGIVFKQVWNARSGQMEFAPMATNDGEDYDFMQEIARSAYADMLHDNDRNSKFAAALEKVVKELKEQSNFVHVLDIGTGTGLLSMLAVRAGADKVTALEFFPPMALIARQIIARNGMADKVNVVNVRSTDADSVANDDRAHLCVAELYDTELIGEGALRSFADAHQRLLKKGARVIPARTKVYAMGIYSDWLSKYRYFDKMLFARDYSINIPERVQFCLGLSSAHDAQLDQLLNSKGRYRLLFKEPALIAEFDFESPDAYNYNESKEIECALVDNLPVDITIDAILFWWEADMDGTGDFIMSTKPEIVDSQSDYHSQWRDHWMHSIYYLPQRTSLAHEKIVKLSAMHDEYCWSFAIKPRNDMERQRNSFAVCNCQWHANISRSSIARIQSTNNNARLIDIIKETIGEADYINVLMVASEYSLLPIWLMILYPLAKVTFITANSHCRQIITDLIEVNTLNRHNITFIEHINDLQNQSAFTHLLSEAQLCGALLPWHTLPLLTETRNRLPHMHSSKLFPSHYELFCIPIFAEHLWKIRAPVNNIHGFDVSQFDQIVQKCIRSTDAPVEPHFLCEYVTLACCDAPMKIFDNHLTSNDQTSIVTIDIDDSRCNCLAFYMTWSCQNTELNLLPSGAIIQPDRSIEWSRLAQQGVYFLDENQRKDLTKTSVTVNARLNSHDGDLCVLVD